MFDAGCAHREANPFTAVTAVTDGLHPLQRCQSVHSCSHPFHRCSQPPGATVGRLNARQVISVDLAEVGADLDHLTLVLCSDGVWDLWEYEEVFQGIVQAPEGGKQRTDTAQVCVCACMSLCDTERATGLARKARLPHCVPTTSARGLLFKRFASARRS